ncbi:hypothetical protein X946_4035 [Burkholderia sp. ABCPW 111]|nr:hypothetical protein X946_4035 [Burkholderia sp. ABCPW 111]
MEQSESVTSAGACDEGARRVSWISGAACERRRARPGGTLRRVRMRRALSRRAATSAAARCVKHRAEFSGRGGICALRDMRYANGERSKQRPRRTRATNWLVVRTGRDGLASTFAPDRRASCAGFDRQALPRSRVRAAPAVVRRALHIAHCTSQSTVEMMQAGAAKRFAQCRVTCRERGPAKIVRVASPFIVHARAAICPSASQAREPARIRCCGSQERCRRRRCERRAVDVPNALGRRCGAGRPNRGAHCAGSVLEVWRTPRSADCVNRPIRS